MTKENPIDTTNDKPTGDKPGEIVFSAALLIIAGFIVYQSVSLKCEYPDISGPATAPLLASLTVLVSCVVSLISCFKRRRAAGANGRRNGFMIAARYAFSRNILSAFFFIAAYCYLLKTGVSFYIVTPLFLWGLMSFIKKGDYISNLIVAAICEVLIYLVFGLLFKVML